MIYEIQSGPKRYLVSTPSLPMLQDVLRRCDAVQPLVELESLGDRQIEYVLPLSYNRLMRDLLSPSTEAAVNAALRA